MNIHQAIELVNEKIHRVKYYNDVPTKSELLELLEEISEALNVIENSLPFVEPVE